MRSSFKEPRLYNHLCVCVMKVLTILIKVISAKIINNED